MLIRRPEVPVARAPRNWRGAVALPEFPMRPDYRNPNWFCVHTKPAREIQAAASLKRLTASLLRNVGEIDVYFPRVKTKIAVAGHLRLVLRPLFPRYFFAKFIWEKAARYVASRPQVIGLVRFGKMPVVVSPDVIQDLLSWSLESDTEIFDPTARLEPGQRVVIKSGLFKGMEAEVISHLNDRKRVALLLDHLQSQTRLILDRTHLKAVV